MNEKQLRSEVKGELINHILPYWMNLKDDTYGGFYGFMDVDLNLDKKADKGAILNSRILWTFSNCYIMLKDKKYLQYAKWAYSFLANHIYDRENGGIYWSVDYKGNPKDTIKHSYNICFAIYALSSYYDASGDEKALDLAIELFNLIETVYKDEYGYKEALTIDFKPQSNEHLSENGILAQKTMNTTLHAFEAYSELYRVSKYAKAKDAMIWILDIFKNKIYNPSKHRLEVFYDEKMNSLIDLHSYGHDIETSWLLERGIILLGDKNIYDSFIPMIEDLYQTILNVGYNGQSVAAECENNIVLEKRNWWTQCEAVIGFYNAYQKTLDNKYLEATTNIWQFLKDYFIDKREGGEWLNEYYSSNGLVLNKAEPMCSPWKCPYHNARMCLELMKRISGDFDDIPVNPNASTKAKELLKYLNDNTANRLITGVHTQTNLMEERQYIKDVTGYYPKLVEFEMLSYSSNIDYENSSDACLIEVKENKGTIDTGLELARKGEIIPMICFHWFSPIGGTDKAFYSKNTDFDPENVLIENSPEQIAFYNDLDIISEQLLKFKNEDIPIIFRPLHENEGTWFWWGRKGGNIAKKLYLLIFDYFVNKKDLNNILWAWSTPTKQAYPGDEYIDIIGWDIYLPKKEKTDYSYHYTLLREQTSYKKLAAITEVGYNPDINIISKTKIPWAFYMTWSKEFSLDGIINTKEELISMYENDYTIKL